MNGHSYRSSAHCADCKATYARSWRARTNGKAGGRKRAAYRIRMHAVSDAQPERFRPVRGLIADLEAGLIYGVRWRPLGSRNHDGYIAIDRGCTADGRAALAHRLVWEAAHGLIPLGMEINHLNGVKDDNRLVNLEQTDRIGNLRHAYDSGLASNQGERHPRSKLTDATVRLIRMKNAEGVPRQALADQLGVSRRCIADVVKGKTWTHITEEAQP